VNAGFLDRRILIPAYQPARLCGLRPLFCGADSFDLAELKKAYSFIRGGYNLRVKFPRLDTRFLLSPLLQPCFFLWGVILLIWQRSGQIDSTSKQTRGVKLSLFSYLKRLKVGSWFGTDFAFF